MSSSTVTSGFLSVVNLSRCTFHSFHPHSEILSVELPSVKEEKRAISLDVFLDADRFSLIVNKKHRSVVNNMLFPWLPEEVEENIWQCFGSNEDYKETDVIPVKEEPKCQKENVDKDKKKNQVVKLTIYTPSSISTKHYKISPPKTDEKALQCSKNHPEFDAIAPSSLPVYIDTSSPPPLFLTPPTSGPASPSHTSEKPSFAFNVGVVNAPRAGVKVAKNHLLDNGNALEMIVDASKTKKIRVFSPEEIRKQSILVEEWKKNIQNSL